MNSLLIYFLSFIFPQSVERLNTLRFEEAYLQERDRAIEVMVNPRYQNSKVENPANVWIELVSFTGLERKACLSYKTPYRNQKGVLAFFYSLEKSCPQFPSSDSYFLEYVDSVNIEIKDNSLWLAYRLPTERNRLMISYHRASKKKYDRYDTFNKASPAFFLGEFPKNFSQLKFGEVCRRINRDCEEVGANTCELCPGGVYEVVGSACIEKTLVCGIRTCGLRNREACPLGKNLSQREAKNDCYPGSRAGLCAEGLTTFCSDNEILICL